MTAVAEKASDVLEIRTNYFDLAFDDPQHVIDEARAALENVDFDTFVVTGLSGASVSGLLAHALDKHFLILRKPDDLSTHSSRRGAGSIGKRWVFLDDFIQSGNTRDRVMGQLAQLIMDTRGGKWDDAKADWVFDAPHETEFVGSYLYLHEISGPGAFIKARKYEQQDWKRAVKAAAKAEGVNL